MDNVLFSTEKKLASIYTRREQVYSGHDIYHKLGQSKLPKTVGTDSASAEVAMGKQSLAGVCEILYECSTCKKPPQKQRRPAEKCETAWRTNIFPRYFYNSWYAGKKLSQYFFVSSNSQYFNHEREWCLRVGTFHSWLNRERVYIKHLCRSEYEEKTIRVLLLLDVLSNYIQWQIGNVHRTY